VSGPWHTAWITGASHGIGRALAEQLAYSGTTVAVSARSEKALQDLHEALEQLETFDPRQAQIVECRYFAGLTIEETATVLDLSVPTVVREWRMARAWLAHALSS